MLGTIFFTPSIHFSISSFIFSLLSSNRKLIKSLLSTWKIWKEWSIVVGTLSYKIQFSYLYSNVPLFLRAQNPSYLFSLRLFPPFLELNNRKLKGKSVLPSERFEYDRTLFPVVGAKVRLRGRAFKSLCK